MAFTNNGKLTATGGAFDLDDGGGPTDDTGSFTAGTGATIAIQDTRSLGTGASVSGAGTFEVTGSLTADGITAITAPLQVSGSLDVARPVTAASLVLTGQISGAATLTVTGPMEWASGANLNGASLVTEGAVTEDSNISVLILNHSLWHNSGTVTLGASSTFYSYDGTGLIVNDAAGTFTFAGASATDTTYLEVTVTNNGTFAATLGGVDLPQLTNLANNVLSGGTYAGAGGTLYLPDTISSNAATLVETGGGGITNQGGNSALEPLTTNSGSIRVGVPITIDGTLTNSGTIHVVSGGSLQVGGFTQSGGTTTLDSGTTLQSAADGTGPIVIDGGTITGNGTVAGALTNHGTLAPGTAPGPLAVSQPVTLGSDGTFSLSITGPTAVGADFGQLSATHSIAVGGTLAILTPTHYLPPIGTTYTIAKAAVISGTFAHLTGTILADRGFAVTYTPTSVVLVTVGQPSISAISPTQGPLTAGTALTVTGHNLQGATFTVGGSAASITSIAADGTSATITAPAGTAGTVDVRASTVAGTSAITAGDHFTYVSAPTVTGATPNSGPAIGGTTLTVSGTGLTGATFTVGGQSATVNSIAANGLSATIVTPAGIGTVDVQAHTSGGFSAVSSSDQFHWVSAGVTPLVFTQPAPAVVAAHATLVTSVTGSTNPVTFSVVSASPSGACTVSATTVSYVHAGTCVLDATQPSDATHLKGEAQVTVTVSQAVPSLTLAVPSGMTYGDPDATVTTTIVPAETVVLSASPASVCSIVSGKVHVTGAGDCAVTATSSATSDYLSATVTKHIGVAQAALTITGADVTAVYGSPVGSASPKYSGFENGDGPSALANAPTCSFSIAAEPTVGDYDGAVTCADAAAANYTISYVPGAVHITPATLTVTASSPTVLLGSPSPTITAAYSGFVYDDSTANAVSAFAVCSTSVGPTTPVGTYPNAATCTGAQAYNYTVTYIAGQVTVVPIIITSTSLPAAGVGGPYTATLTEVGGKSAFKWTLTSGSLPAGLKLSTAGVISGTPTTLGHSVFAVTVTDAAKPANTATASLSLDVVPMYVASVNLPADPVDAAYSQKLLTSGGKSSYTWKIISGALPTGLKLSTAGAITGTGTVPQTTYFTVSVTDSSKPAHTATADESITVTPLTITTESLPNAPVSVAYKAQITKTGGKSSYKFVIYSGALPPGLTMSATTGAISGTPTSPGTWYFFISLTDSSKPTPMTAYGYESITVTPMAITTSSLPNGTVKKAYSAKLTVSGGKSSYVWKIADGSLPSGLKLSTAGAFTGTPTTVGSYTFDVQVTDASKPPNSAEAQFTIVIQ